MLFFESRVALCAAFGGKHLFRVPSAVPLPLGLPVGFGSIFLATLQFPSVFPLSQHRVGKNSNSPSHGGQIYGRNPRQHSPVIRVATPMDIRHSPFPRLRQRDDLLAPILRVFLPSRQTQLHQAVDRSAERALVKFQPVGDSLEVYAPKSIQLEQDVTLRNRDATAVCLILKTPTDLAFEYPKFCSKGAQGVSAQRPDQALPVSCHDQLLYTPTMLGCAMAFRKRAIESNTWKVSFEKTSQGYPRTFATGSARLLNRSSHHTPSSLANPCGTASRAHGGCVSRIGVLSTLNRAPRRSADCQDWPSQRSLRDLTTQRARLPVAPGVVIVDRAW